MKSYTKGEGAVELYAFGQLLTNDLHFRDHMEHHVPVQIYRERDHADIGFVENYSSGFVQINDILYCREHFTFVSRPGY